MAFTVPQRAGRCSAACAEDLELGHDFVLVLARHLICLIDERLDGAERLGAVAQCARRYRLRVAHGLAQAQRLLLRAVQRVLLSRAALRRVLTAPLLLELGRGVREVGAKLALVDAAW